MYEPLFPGPLGGWLAGIGVVSCVYWAYRVLAALIRFAQASPGDTSTPAVVPAPRQAPPAPPLGLADDLPVIVAAVAAMLDSHRIVHIQELPHGQVWSAQGRWLHQTSHRPH